ncbi:LysR family transcriptional regulator [Castellaniella ginsengisoli]
MELRQIQYFICLFEEGSVTRAARRLNIVQPALSMQIAKLEAELAQKLFERTHQGMVPTVAGRQMYELYLPIMRDLFNAREQMLSSDKELSGHVNVGIIASIAQGVLSNVLAEFVALHPKVTVTVADGYSAILSEWVAADMLEAAIINRPRRRIGLHTEYLIDEDLILVTGKGFQTPLPEQVPLRMVQSFDLALPTRHHGLRAIIDGLAATEDVNISPRLETDSIISILKLVASTQFVTILPRISVIYRAEREQLNTYQVVSPRLVRQVVCVTHPRRPLSAAGAAFMSIFTRHLRNSQLNAPA